MRCMDEAPCAATDGTSSSSCIGGSGTIAHERTTLVTADASWGLGIVILRAEVLAHPALFGTPGKAALLVHPEEGLSSARLGHSDRREARPRR
jgi:hypothetical protein